jgi:hypothetical protein
LDACVRFRREEFPSYTKAFRAEAAAPILNKALANQYTDQLPHAVRSAVIGNAGSLVVFRVARRRR